MAGTGKGWKSSKKDKVKATEVFVNGDKVKVQGDMDFEETVREFAREKGWHRFRLFVDGKEIEEDDEIPSSFDGIKEVQISKYDEAGH